MCQEKGLPFVNIHTHCREGEIYILDISSGKEWREGELCSYGVHPLYIRGEEQIVQLEVFARENKIVAIGEAGLDRNSETTMEVQIRYMEQEILLSEKYGLPLIIHCVRAYSELLALHKKFHPRQAWIIHGYNNNKEILKQLLKRGFYISVGKKVFIGQSNISRFLSFIPPNRLFIETDDSDFPIKKVYEQTAQIRKMSLAELECEVYANFQDVFGKGESRKGVGTDCNKENGIIKY